MLVLFILLSLIAAVGFLLYGVFADEITGILIAVVCFIIFGLCMMDATNLPMVTKTEEIKLISVINDSSYWYTGTGIVADDDKNSEEFDCYIISTKEKMYTIDKKLVTVTKGEPKLIKKTVQLKEGWDWYYPDSKKITYILSIP